MQIATVTQFASKLTEKGATRSSVVMSKRMPSGSTELKEMPRRSGYAEGAEGDAAWCKDVDAASAGYRSAPNVGTWQGTMRSTAVYSAAHGQQ